MRTSHLSNLYIHNISDSSALICGDTGNLMSKSNAIRIQKSSTDTEEEEEEVEVEFSDYSLFQLKIPQWEEEDDEEEDMITTVNTSSMIRVSCIKILSISDGTTFQVGSNRTMDLESRIKMIDGISNTEPSDG